MNGHTWDIRDSSWQSLDNSRQKVSYLITCRTCTICIVIMLGCYGIDGRLWPLRSSSPVGPHKIDRFAMTTFRDVLAQLRAADLTHLAPRLVDQGVRNIDQMNGLTPEQVLAVAPEQRDLEAFCRLLGRSIPKRTTEIRTRGRRDLPVVTSSTRGSIIGALEAAAPAVQQEAIQNLVRDQYANTTRNTRDSRWNLWTRLATSWKLPPLPITAELVQAIASSLKRGRYRSSAQVFSMARQQHVAHTGCRLSADIEQQITMSIRSIERGLGPSTLKDAFIVEDLAAATDSSNTPPPAEDHWAEYLYDCVLVTPICCWWMLRGIEVAAARFSDVWFETTSFGRLAFFTLPCHKTDTIGMCITRSHPCTCSDNLAALCPYHALDTFIRRNHRPGTDRNDEYLFYGRRGGPITHLETIEVFRKAIASTGAELTRPDRWGSDAVRRYVQEAPLSCASGSSARPCISKTPTQMVKKYLETITSKFWVKNTSTNVIHISGAPEFSTENIHWHTLCGWRYGQAPHTRFWSLPEGNQCQRCFRMQENQAITDANSDEEAVWNAPSESFS